MRPGPGTEVPNEPCGSGRSSSPTRYRTATSHRSETQTLVTSGIEDAIAAARAAVGDKDVALMGGGLVTEALVRGRTA